MNEHPPYHSMGGSTAIPTRSLRVLYIRDSLIQTSFMLCRELEILAAHVSTFPYL
jgi:hypothetical protein